MLGNWTGTYRHTSKRIPESRRKQATKFSIEITEFDGINFSGVVEDDLKSGGTKGIGQIKGKVNKQNISFIKQMPIQTFLTPDNELIEENKPHNRIYYSGKIDSNEVSGTWKIRFGVGRFQNKFALFPATRGEWNMKKVLP